MSHYDLLNNLLINNDDDNYDFIHRNRYLLPITNPILDNSIFIPKETYRPILYDLELTPPITNLILDNSIFIPRETCKPIEPLTPSYLDKAGDGGPLDAGFLQQQIQIGHMNLPYFDF